MQQRESSPSQSYFWPTVLAVGLHVIIFGMLFVSFSMTPELPPSKPIVQATLYQLKSQSQATTQTNQKIAGEAKKTAAKQFESEQMEQRGVKSVMQALRYAPGVSTENKGGAVVLSDWVKIRGFDSTNNYYDGMMLPILPGWNVSKKSG